jgi:hypothetical protein
MTYNYSDDGRLKVAHRFLHAARSLVFIGGLGCLPVTSGTMLATSITYDCQSPFFADNPITQVVDTACSVQSDLFYFDTPLSANGINSSDYVYLDGTQPLTSPNSPGLSFFGSTNGSLDSPVGSDTIDPIEVQFSVTEDTGQFEISGSSLDHFTEGGTSGTMGGTVKICAGAYFSGDSFADDGCVDDGGTLYTMIVGESPGIIFTSATTEVDVWDQINLSGGATFGTIGQTFTQEAVAPEPTSFCLIGFALLYLVIHVRRRDSPSRVC